MKHLRTAFDLLRRAHTEHEKLKYEIYRLRRAEQEANR
jgi:hypothetical protein